MSNFTLKSIFLTTSLLSLASAYAQLPNPVERPSRLLPYTQCVYSGGLAPLAVDRAPRLPMARPVETASGVKRVSVADGYRVMLAFFNTDPFVNLKIEMSEAGRYPSDKKIILEQMESIASSTQGVSKISVERSTIDGVELAALNRPVLESSVLSIYSFFDDASEVIATAYILNQLPARRAFDDMTHYRGLRDAFVKDAIQCMVKHRNSPEMSAR